VLNWLWFPDRREQLQVTLKDADNPLDVIHLNAIQSVLGRKEKIAIAELDIRHLNLPALHHPLWQALPALYTRECFSRLWVFQEAMLARSATMLCGDCSIPWKAFRQLGNDFNDTELLWINRQLGQSTNLRHFMWPHNEGEWFWLYLIGSRDLRCSLKEDRVYGLLALASDDIRKKIKVESSNDSNNYIRVYQSTARALLDLIPLEAILAQANSPGKPPPCLHGVLTGVYSRHPHQVSQHGIQVL
jgi:hypothetical protein